MYQLAGFLSLDIATKYFLRYHHGPAPITQGLEAASDFQAKDGTLSGILDERFVSRQGATIVNKNWTLN